MRYFLVIIRGIFLRRGDRVLWAQFLVLLTSAGRDQLAYSRFEAPYIMVIKKKFRISHYRRLLFLFFF